MISEIQAKSLADDPDGAIPAADVERRFNKPLKDKFYSALADIKSTLNEEQILRLEQIKHHNGIKQVGLAKYLSSSHFKSAISDEDAKALEHGR